MKYLYLLLPLIVGLLALIDSIGSILSFAIFGSIYYFLTSKIRSKNLYYEHNTRRIQFISVFFSIVTIGLILASINYVNYESYFMFMGDDSVYFYNAKNFYFDSNLFSIDKFYVTNLFNHTIYRLVSMYKEPNVIDLLFSHWSLATIICLLSLDIACIVNRRIVGISKMYLAFFSQTSFFFTLPYFYRDTYAILFMILGVYYGLRGFIGTSVINSFVSGSIRGVNGVFTLIILFLIRIVGNRREISIKSKLLTLLSIGVFIVVVSLPPVQSLIVSKGVSFLVDDRNVSDMESMTIDNYVQNRQRYLFEHEGLYNSGASLGTGYAFYVKALAVPLISPGNLYLSTNSSFSVTIYNEYSGIVKGVNPVGLTSFISMLLLPFLIASLAISVAFIVVRGSTMQFVFLIAFTLLYLTSAYISLIPRHYMAYVIIITTIISASDANVGRNQSSWYKVIVALVYMFLVYNTINYMLSL